MNKGIILWSGGKDSAYSLYKARQQGIEVTHAITGFFRDMLIPPEETTIKAQVSELDMTSIILPCDLVTFHTAVEKTIKKMLKNQKQTMLEKYGVEYSSQRPEFKELIRETKLKKYNDSTYVNKEKMKQTNLKKYGVEHYSQTEEAKEIKKKKSLEKYGTSCTMNNKEVRERTKQNNLIKYGIENASQTKEAIEKRKQTFISKYGVEMIFKCEEFRKENVLRVKQFWANAPFIECPFCNKKTKNKGNYNRYHGDKCKQKP